ncbi:MAG TPA: N-acetylmuramoyl-L-alanine amidase [Symbiobacteriaceae bacterium]|nr:N-acetylmuramoyl-L-alanine amidase [Symbiobacteriaceae bacterium]
MSYTGTAIMGAATARLDQLEAKTLRINPSAPSIAGLYLTLGQRLGVRGDVAYAQALHETNYFRYGGLVRPEQNNYAGIGATGPGSPGYSFATPEDGVLAHLQHLYAYASIAPLPAGMLKVDPRFDLVERGVAPNLGDLNGRWAVPGTTYGQMIDRILGEILMEPTAGEPYSVENAYLDPSSQNRPGPCSDGGCWQGVQGIVVHRTASPSMNARAIRNYFNNAPDGRFASSQFVLDDTVILQLMPVGEVAYHTIGKNYTHLGIETCEHNWGTPAWEETYRKLVWLTAYLARSYHLPLNAVTGHFQWDPVNRPYDPTHPGWTPREGKATGLFRWEQFLADVEAAMADAPAPPAPAPEPQPQPEPEPQPGPLPGVRRIPVAVARGGVAAPCVEGLLIGSETYVPIRPYTGCIAPDATVLWNEREWSVTVELPAGSALQAPTLSSKLTHREYVERLRSQP